MITVSEQAARAIANMRTQVQAIAEAWKDDPKVALKASLSAARCLSQIMEDGALTDTSVSRDGEMSLLVSSYITIGVIFFPAHRRVKAPLPGDIHLGYSAPYVGRYCMTGLSDGYCAHPYIDDGTEEGSRTCADHIPLPAALPIPGEWSMHS